MKNPFNRREFVKSGVVAGLSLALPICSSASQEKSLLVFTKSSGWEHDVVKRINGKPSIVEQAVSSLGIKHGFHVITSKDGRIFDSKDFRKHAAVFFYTTGDLTTPGTDKNPPMSPEGKKSLLDAIHQGLGFIGTHSAADTFHTQPDPKDESNRYVAHGNNSDPYVRMLGAEFITHGNSPQFQNANLVINDASFPGLQGLSSPMRIEDEWYSLKDFSPGLHVILTLDTKDMSGKPYQRPPYPVTWARMDDKGKVFYTAIGHRPENWSNPVFLNLLGGGIRWAIGETSAYLDQNLTQSAPGYAVIPPR